MKKNILLYCLILFLSACEGDILITEPQKLVVEGYIEDGNCPVIMLSKTIPVSETYQSTDELDQYIVKWAKVCIIHDGDTTILTGMPDRRYYPPYVYTTGRLRAKAGEHYKMTVDYQSFHATAETTVLPTVALDSIWTEPVDGSNDLYKIYATFHDSPDTEDYYNFYVQDTAYSEMFLSSDFGLFADTQFNGQAKTVCVSRGHRASSETYQPYFHSGESVIVKFSKISRDSFNFWQKYQDMVTFSRNMILSTFEDLPTNFNGAIGYFHGQSGTYYKVQIP